jgi:3-hydroxyacyl-[acyl-carrier-protein] dehydratase
MRFYLIDRVLSLEPGKTIEGIKCWSLSDEVFNEHFPGFPVVPGVFLIESMAQLMGVLIEESYKVEFKQEERVYPILSIVHKAKFRDVVRPGDKCHITGELRSLDYNRSTGALKIFVDDELMADAELSFTILKKEDLPPNDFFKKREEFYFAINLKKPQKKNKLK